MSEDFPRHEKKPVSLDEMITAAWDEAFRLRCSQEALVAAKVRPYPDADKLRTADVYEATAKFLQLIKPVIGGVRALIRRGR